jgi:hypothetical protein
MPPRTSGGVYKFICGVNDRIDSPIDPESTTPEKRTLKEIIDIANTILGLQWKKND